MLDALHFDSNDPIVQTLQNAVLAKNKKIEEAEGKMNTILRSLRDFQHQQKILFNKYQTTRQDYKELQSNMAKLLWEDLFSPCLNYDFLALREVDTSIIEEDDKVGDYTLGEILGEGQFATVKACYGKNEKGERR